MDENDSYSYSSFPVVYGILIVCLFEHFIHNFYLTFPYSEILYNVLLLNMYNKHEYKHYFYFECICYV